MGWLDAPLKPGQPARIQLGVCDATTGELQRTVQLGEVIDNHCGPAMILDPYGRVLAETWKDGDDMVVADLDASLLKVSTGKRWIKTRRPEL